MGKNNYAFIDSQNLNLGISTNLFDDKNILIYYGWKLDYKRFRIYLRDKYDISKAFLFIGYVPGNEKLYAELQQAGYVLIFKPTLIYRKNGKGFIKGNVDAELVMHTLIEMSNYDKAVIVTGDGDFHCLIEYLIKENKLKRLLIPNKTKYSALLRKFVSSADFLNQLKNKLGK